MSQRFRASKWRTISSGERLSRRFTDFGICEVICIPLSVWAFFVGIFLLRSLISADDVRKEGCCRIQRGGICRFYRGSTSSNTSGRIILSKLDTLIWFWGRFSNAHVFSRFRYLMYYISVNRYLSSLRSLEHSNRAYKYSIPTRLRKWNPLMYRVHSCEARHVQPSWRALDEMKSAIRN